MQLLQVLLANVTAIQYDIKVQFHLIGYSFASHCLPSGAIARHCLDQGKFAFCTFNADMHFQHLQDPVGVAGFLTHVFVTVAKLAFRD